MSTPPPSRGSKRKSIGEVVQQGAKRLLRGLMPSTNSESSVAPLPDASSTTPLYLTPTRSMTPGTTETHVDLSQSILSYDTSLGASTLDTDSAPIGVGAKPRTTSKMRKATTDKLESALRTLRSSVVALPTLHKAVENLATTKDVEEYDELTSELSTITYTLMGYLNVLNSDDFNDNLVCRQIALSIETEVEYIKRQRDRRKGIRILGSSEDDVKKVYRRIAALFRQLQNEIGIQNLKTANEQRKMSLLRGILPIDDARYNSSYSTIIRRRGCMVETREGLQSELRVWVQDPNGAKVYWMNGTAGTGKTTIAYSLCEWLEANHQLGASFFCSRSSNSCRNANSIIPTIAYQLARHYQAFRLALCNVLEDDPDAGKLNVAAQFAKLVQQPMTASGGRVPDDVVIVIDALDECDDEYGVGLILGTLLESAASLSLKFFVASRPEPAIQAKMISPSGLLPGLLYSRTIEEEDIQGLLVGLPDFVASPDEVNSSSSGFINGDGDQECDDSLVVYQEPVSELVSLTSYSYSSAHTSTPLNHQAVLSKENSTENALELGSAPVHGKTSAGLVAGGSFGDIWRGKLYDETDVAIKVWRFTSLTEDKTKGLKRAMREIYSWSKLKHDNIHRLLGVVIFQDRLGMVSEWMEQGNLREYIRKNPDSDRYQLCFQTASSLDYLHEIDMVHGDLKACNFLVSHDGVVKLTDFDHMIMLDCSLRFSETSRVGGGTLRWMAPELVIFEPCHQRNKRTDVYALGMTMLEIISGRMPYELECPNDLQIYRKLSMGTFPMRTEQFNADESAEEWWRLLARCWDHTPDLRPTAGEIHSSITVLLAVA